MAINFYYNYYVPKNPIRAVEVGSCFAVLLGDKNVAKIVMISDDRCVGDDPRVIHEAFAGRPTFGHYFGLIKKYSSADDINVIINSDCFIDPATTHRLNRIRPGEAYCLTRQDIASFVPLRVDRRKSESFRHDMQDCWVIRGVPREGMWLEFSPGRRGCDNRLAHELMKVGYNILDPHITIRVLHYHHSAEINTDRDDCVPPPYAYPKKHGLREHVYLARVGFAVSVTNAWQPVRVVLSRIKRLMLRHRRETASK